MIRLVPILVSDKIYTSVKILELKQKQPIAKGRARYVYPYPGNSDLIIKVMRPEAIDEGREKNQGRYKAFRRYGEYVSYMREIGEYVAAYARKRTSLPFVQRVAGLIETDLGLGLVLEAVRDREGRLAPSLSNLLAQKTYTPEIAAALEIFIRSILESDVIVADLHPGNIVYGYEAEHGHRFVMIDGLGLYTLFPFKAISTTLNRRSKRRHIERLRGRMTAWLPEAMANSPVSGESLAR